MMIEYSVEFSLKGEIIFNYENSKIEEKQINELNSFILSKLKEQKDEIENEIIYDIASILKQSIDVSIEFRSGSILLGGLAVIKWISVAGGVFSFIDYARIIVDYSVRRVIHNRIQNSTSSNIDSHIKVEVHPNAKNIQETEIKQAILEKDSNKKELNWTRFLVWITLLNAVIIFGGNIYNAVEIKSVLQEANAIENDLIKTSNDIENLQNVIEREQFTAETKLRNLPLLLEQRYANSLIVKSDSLLVELDSLGQSIDEYKSQIDAYNEDRLMQKIENVYSITAANTKVGFKSQKWYMFILYSFVLLNFLLILALFRRTNR